MYEDKNITSSELAPASAIVIHRVKNFDNWRNAFNAHAKARYEAGILSTHISTDVQDPDLVSVYLESSDLHELNAFLTSKSLFEAMKNSGVIGMPEIHLISPILDTTTKDHPYPAAIIKEKVQNFKIWYDAYLQHAQEHGQYGIVGHYIFQSFSDPNFVILYLQGTSIDRIRNHFNSDQTREFRRQAGVRGRPQISFVNGIAWESLADLNLKKAS